MKITLAGGGSAAGLHIGVLKFLEKKNVTFDVWALSCIGAWVGVIYNQFDGKNAKQTEQFFRDNIFRGDDVYARFPINSVFGPDLIANALALRKFFLSIDTYDKLWLPQEFLEVMGKSIRFLCDPGKWNNEGDRNQLCLDIMSVNPFMRFLVSMLYLSEVPGLARIYYPESNLIKAINIEKLRGRDKPFIYHNAWNISRRQLQLFSNQEGDGYYDISLKSLCACSALPYVEQTVDIDGDTYCEGALVDTVNFKNLLEDHPDLDEIWISRIVDARQIRAPRNLHDALGNLCMLFAATVGEDDVRLFK